MKLCTIDIGGVISNSLIAKTLHMQNNTEYIIFVMSFLSNFSKSKVLCAQL